MKKEQVQSIRITAFSDFEQLVFDNIISRGCIFNYQLAALLFKDSKRKPKSISNAITSAVRQINRKLIFLDAEVRITGEMKGRSGKLLRLEFIR